MTTVVRPALPPAAGVGVSAPVLQAAARGRCLTRRVIPLLATLAEETATHPATGCQQANAHTAGLHQQTARERMANAASPARRTQKQPRIRRMVTVPARRLSTLLGLRSPSPAP